MLKFIHLKQFEGFGSEIELVHHQLDKTKISFKKTWKYILGKFVLKYLYKNSEESKNFAKLTKIDDPISYEVPFYLFI